MTQKLNVLILAAGLGTRLRPLTSGVPKPLVPVVDASILELQMRKAKMLGNVTLHANAHYLADQIVAEGVRLGFEKIWVEPEILGTAGPLSRIYREGYRGGLLVMNGDAYCQFDLNAFVRNAIASSADCALLGVDFPKVNTFRIGEGGRLVGIAGRFGEENALASATFSGVSWYSDNALSRMDAAEFDIREFWKKEIAAGRAPFVDLSQKNALWIDMGSPEGLKCACDARRMELGIECWVGGKACSSNTQVVRSVVQKGIELPPSAIVVDSILFEGTNVMPGEQVTREIRGEGFCWRV